MTEGQQAKPIPLYQCHKQVRAFKIKDVLSHPMLQSGDWTLVPEDKEISPIQVSNEYILRHVPEVGGYYVKYQDGYESYSPAAAFESGYKLIETHEHDTFGYGDEFMSIGHLPEDGKHRIDHVEVDGDYVAITMRKAAEVGFEEHHVRTLRSYLRDIPKAGDIMQVRGKMLSFHPANPA